MSQGGVPPGVGRTALMTASARAKESRRPDRLFVDPWADVLVDAALGHPEPGPSASMEDARAHDGSEMWDAFRLYFAGRTPFLDRQVRDGVTAGARQVVLLAAGLDARAARLDLPDDVRVFELDSEPVLRFKTETLARAGLDTPRRVSVPADLAGDWVPALETAGFRRDVPTVWIAEGLLFYLGADACHRLRDAVVRCSAPGSRVAVEYWDRKPVHADFDGVDRIDEPMLDAVLGMFTTGPAMPPGEWLSGTGIELDRLTDVAAEIAAQGRPLPWLFDPAHPDAITPWLASGRLTAGRTS